MTHPTRSIPALRREVRVACDAHRAFRLFTERIGEWWPLATHSVYGEHATLAFEGDRLVERHGAEESLWGEVLDWDPPRGFTITWHPGHGTERATEVTVVFQQDDDGTTVRLTHVGWDILPAPQTGRENYATGWIIVLGHLVDHVAATA